MAYRKGVANLNAMMGRLESKVTNFYAPSIIGSGR
jgi:hypothetical protein